MNQPVRWIVRFVPSASPIRHPERLFGIQKPGRIFAAMTLAAVCICVPAQQPYGYGYSGQYASPPSNYAQPQYPQPQYPQYQQPQYQQPQYQQPQYQQPQYQQQPYAGAQQSYADQGVPDLGAPQATPAQQPLGAGDLEELLAPIALYPDNLVAQILAASTYPAQVTAADQWVNNMRLQGYSSPDQIAAGAQAQTNWDPSIKSLTAFPQVLDTLNQNLQWTVTLGNAYYNQPQDVMQTIQVLRQRAQQAGNLVNTPQEQVTDDQGYVEVAPANPGMVYVPAYNPWAVYGAPLTPYPGFSLAGALGSFFGASPVRFGLGIAMAAFERTPFGWMGWGLSWLAHSIFFNHSPYFTHSTTVADWGFPHGGQRAFGDRGLPIYGGNNHRPMPMSRGGNAYQAARSGAYERPAYGYSETARNDGYTRGYGSTHPEVPGQQMAYNRAPQQLARPQTYTARPQTYAGGGSYSYVNRPAQNYASPYSSNRSPSYQEPNFKSSRAYQGREGYNDLARNERSGGFHLFGGSHESGSDGGRPPKNSRSESFHAPKSSGSFGHEKAPKESHSGGHGHHH